MKKYFENSNFSGTKGNWNSGEPQGEPEVNFYAELKKQEEKARAAQERADYYRKVSSTLLFQNIA